MTINIVSQCATSIGGISFNEAAEKGGLYRILDESLSPYYLYFDESGVSFMISPEKNKILPTTERCKNFLLEEAKQMITMKIF